MRTLFAFSHLSIILLLSTGLYAEPIKVTLGADGTLLRGGKPYFIKGGGGETHLEELAKRGGNSLRTWSDNGLDVTLEKAKSLGLTVSAGIWLESECSWFSYKNPDHRAKQLSRVQGIVRKYRDHPALLAWGVGNECDGDGQNVDYWKQLEELVKVVKKEDPNHPTFTAVAGITKERAAGLNAHTPSLDFLGINTYGALPRLPEVVARCEWKRPYAVTEYGARGFWEIKKTSWGAPMEQLPHEKAEFIKMAYPKGVGSGKPCIGGYAFLWGHKNEATATWFGILTKSGETTPMTDALEFLWTGKQPANLAPHLAKLICDAHGKTLKPGSRIEASVEATDPEKDPLSYRWWMLAEQSGHNDRGHPIPPKEFPKSIAEATKSTVTATAPSAKGTYRLYISVMDGKGHAAEANAVFQVQP